MLSKLPILLRKSTWLLVLLFITSALPARAQDEWDVEMQEGQFKFEYSNDLNGYIISPNKDSGWGWEGQETQFLSIPSTRLKDGKPVVGLSGFHSLKYLDIIEFESPCHVKYICDKCFEYCTSLGLSNWEVELTLPETVETIGDSAFRGCTSLRNVNLSSNLKSIGVSAFEKCSSLTSITLPKSLKVIREYAFRNCALINSSGICIGGLQSVVFEDEVDFYTNDVYCFYNNVFWGCTNLSSVKLPKRTPGRFIIPMGTFGYCSSLRSIEFPPNTGKIEQLAFYRSGLEKLDLTNIEWEEPFYLPGYYTFAACENLKTVTAKGKVHFDGLYTFQECTALETVTFTGSGNDYTVMNPDIFKRCSNLQSVKFYRLKGNGQSNDMDSVFTDCKNLVSVTSECTPEISKIGYSCFDGCTSLTTLSLPQTEFIINETAFRNCTALESFDFSNVTSIGKASFSGCTGLTSLNFTDLTSIDTEAFKDCTALTSVNFNTSSETSFASTIGSQAFTGCSALASLNFNSSSYDPPTVASEDAFDASHYATTKVNMPGKRYRDFAADAIWNKFYNLKRPEKYVYTPVAGGYSIRKGEYALVEDFTDIEIPATYNSQDVVAIEEGAFKDLPFLYSVTLHDKLTSIGANAFAGCDMINAVINKSKVPLTEDVCPENVFHSEAYNGTLTVPFGSIDAYKNTAPWSGFKTIEQGFGERVLTAPQASHVSGEFNGPFKLTLTNPNRVGTIYYYTIPEGDVSNAVREVYTYTEPITINSSRTIVAYVTDDMTCSEPISFDYSYVIIGTENGLDKVLAANADDWYQINTNLYGHYFDGTYLYASTIGNSGSSKNTINEDKKSEAGSDIESEFIQEDWVAISGLTADFVGQEIGSGNMANVISNDEYPVITFAEDVTGNMSSDISFNTYRVQNFNINTESAAVSNIWLVAPQPAEYCTVAGYMDAAKINTDEGYLVLQSAKDATTLEDETVIEPLSMKVYYDAASITLGVDGWYTFTGIVSKDGDGLKFTALEVEDIPAGIKDVNAGNARIFAANGNINVTSDAKAGITVYSTTGQLVASLEASSATIAVSPGFYIVKVGNLVKKIAVY